MTHKKIVSIKKIDKFDLYDITVKDDHCFELDNGIIAHNSMYPKDIVSGGTGSIYSADNIYIVGRQQEKDGTELAGYNFIINVEKSRYVKEKSKIPITVTTKGGVSVYSGLLDMALESKHVIKPNNGWYSRVDEDGVIEDRKWRIKETDTKEFWEPILKQKSFKEWISNKYKVSEINLISDEETSIDINIEDDDLEAFDD